MKRWFLCALVAPLATACSQGGSGGAAGAPNFSGANCSLKPVMAGMSSQASTQAYEGPLAFSRDPFESNGKVVLASEAGTFSGMTTQSTTGKRFAAGTQFTVSVREACENPGPIARAVVSGDDSSEAPTPSGVRSYDWAIPGAITLSKLTEAVEADPCIAGITEAGVAEVNTLPTDPLVTDQAHLAMLEAGVAYDRFVVPSVTIQPVVVAIIDTGVDVVHEDLKNVLWQNPGEIPGNGIDDDKNGYKDDYNGYNFEDKRPSPAAGSKWGGYHHGTHVAGLTAAQGGNATGGTGVMGMGVRIMGLNVFGSTSGARVSDVANAIRYAADNGADIVNLSLGGSGRNATYESAINYALKKGVTILAASGNDGQKLTTTNFMAPGSYGNQYAGMMNIGSLNSADGSISYFSNYSPTMVELGAPGAEKASSGRGLLSTYPGNKYIRAMGTSMATPVAAGGAAMAISLLRQRGYSPSPATVEAILEVSSKKLASLQTKIREGRSMNLRNLAEFIEKTYPPTSGQADPGVPGHDACAVATAQGTEEI